MYFAGKLVYLIVRASNQLAVNLEIILFLAFHSVSPAFKTKTLDILYLNTPIKIIKSEV